MKCLVVLCGLLAVASASPGAGFSYSYANPAGVTFRGTGVAPALSLPQPQYHQTAYQSPYQNPYPQNPFQIGIAQPVAAPVAAPLPAPVQYAAPAVAAGPAYAAPAYAHHAYAPAAYAAPAPVAHAVAPAVAVHQKVGYVNNQVLTHVPGVANVPVTKLALTQGVTQKLVDVAQPAVKNRRVKVRRPALRKEFYDIEHRIIVRPAGSATLELSQPISKEQKGPAVITPTEFQQIAPVVRYGTARQIIDGPGVSPLAASQVALARGALPPQGPAPGPQEDFGRRAPEQGPQEQPQQQQPQPQLRSAGPRRPLQLRPQGPPQQQQQQQQQGPNPFEQQQQEQRQQFEQVQQQQRQQFEQQQQFQQQVQQQQQQAQQQQQQAQARANDDAIEINAEGPGPQGPQQGPPQPQGPPQQQQGPAPQPFPAPRPQGRSPQGLTGLTLDPNMPLELQGRLLELLSAKGGTVTEVLNENGAPANQASVLQVADALQDVNLQGGEKITTRRIVVTRPIETVQEVDIQEPATKLHRVAVNTPTLFKTPIQGVAQVPVNVPAVKNIATPVVKTHYAPAAYGAYAAAPAYAGPAYAPAGVAYA